MLKGIPAIVVVMFAAGVSIGVVAAGGDLGIPTPAVVALNVILWLVLGPALVLGSRKGQPKRKLTTIFLCLCAALYVFGAAIAFVLAPKKPAVEDCSCCSLYPGAVPDPDDEQALNEALRQCLGRGGSCGAGCEMPPARAP